MLDALGAGQGALLAIEGEPGIGKSRLLAHLADAATERGCVVLRARASEFESDLPFALWTEALDDHVAGLGERKLSRLGLTDTAALSAVLPALAEPGGAPVPADRHRTHRALRDLLGRLAETRPLVLCLDDVHWADRASVDALAALVRRPLTDRCWLAVAAREGQLAPSLAAALADALRDVRATRLALAPLSGAEAAELVGEAAAAIYPESGGNPFYLEQLARVRGRARATAGISADSFVPPAVAAAMATELAGLAPPARRLLDAAAVAGDPFEPGLAAEVAELPEPEALEALDELLARALVRQAGAPRRFAFRHPVVRHAVYEATPPGWRLGAHARAAHALERQGAGPVERAHHVEHAARPGDEDAIGLLAAAAGELQSPAPAAAARFHAAALRLLPDRPEARERRKEMQRLLADAQAASGDPVAARETLLEALRTAGAGERLGLTVGVANAEWWLGRNSEARRRLQVALGELPAQPSADRIRLRLALALTALSDCDPREARAQASDARDDARAIGDPVFEAAALAGGVLARVTAADDPEPAGALDESVAAFERLSGAQQAQRLPAFWMHGRARHALGQFDVALREFERGSALAAQTGRESILLQLTVESVATLIELGRLADAAAPGRRAWSCSALRQPAHAALGSQRPGLGAARGGGGGRGAAARGRRRRDRIPAGFTPPGQPGWCLGAALTAAGNPERAARRCCARSAAPRCRGAGRRAPHAAADLVEAQLACGRLEAAEEVLEHGEAAAARPAPHGLRP